MIVTIHHSSGESEKVQLHIAKDRVAADCNWSFEPHPPKDWQYEIPRYQAREALLPARHSRYLTEPPHAHEGESNRWQYGTEDIAEGQIVETTSWPHRSFVALNHSARVILEAFLLGTRSRMPVQPWLNDRVFLADGLSFGPITTGHRADEPERELRAGHRRTPADRGARPRVM